MPLIGYARVSTEDQATRRPGRRAEGRRLRRDLSRAHVRREGVAAGAGKGLGARAPRRTCRRRRLRLDRSARSLSHLLSVIAELDAKGAHFKSLADPIDTTTPQGRFALQVLGAVAELERALIQERTKDGLRAAKKRGRVGGNPKLRAGDRDAIKQIVGREGPSLFRARQPNRRTLAADRRRTCGPVIAGRTLCACSTPRRERPNGPPQPLWSVERLKRAVKRFAAEGLADPALLPTRRPQVQQRTCHRL